MTFRPHPLPAVPPRRAVLLRPLLLLLLALLAFQPLAAWAGPVSWVEVPPTTEGRQWWDAGSLRLNRDGRLTVLSRFQPAPSGDSAGEESSAASQSDDRKAQARAAAAAELYVMELDCEQELYRDISVNGLPRFRAIWRPTGRDDLTASVLHQACDAYRS